MLGKRPRPFLRTTSKSQLMPSNGDDIPPAVVVVEAKPVLGSPRPHHVVVGFDLGPENQQHLHGGFCESPRSVLEPNSLCAPVHDQHFRSPRSPRSALGSLLSGHHHRDHRNPCNEEVGLGVMAAMKAEGDAEDAKLEILKASLKSEHVLISGRNPLQSPLQSQGPGRVANPYPNPREVAGENHYDDDGDDEMDIRDSIFSTASPASNCCSFDFLAMDFLSVCFFCKHHLAQGKDIYMYRGDHAFCSSECRCQQIVIDDCKERRSSAASCYPGAAAQSNNSVLVAKPAAVA